MTTKREVNYWKRRFLFEKKQQLQNTAEYETAMRARLKEVEQVLEQEVDYWLKRYADNQEISTKNARKILSTIGTRDWHMTLREFKAKAKTGGFDKELDAEYFRSQLSRLENIDEQLTNLLAQYATSEANKMESSLSNQYQQTYMHSIYLTQLEQAKLSSDFANVNEYQVKAIVNSPWRGSDFSKRIWKNYTEILPNELGDALLRGSVLGHSNEQIFKMMRQRLKDVEDYQLHRLVITEMGHVAEEATADAYKEEGVEQYQYLATLESHTCEECAHLDEKVFNLKDKVEGLNYPLIHPYCRCTTMPYIEGLPDSSERWTRDPETGKGEYVENMTFNEWKKQYVDEPRYRKIKALLGEYAPDKREYDILSKNSKDYKLLENDLKVVNYINNSEREHVNENDRRIAQEAYFSFKENGIRLTGHAALQYSSRIKQKKTGKFLFNFQTIQRIDKLPANFIDTRNSRLISYYDKMALIKEPETGEIVTIIRQRKPGKKWNKIEKK